jgi:hypothetical protein
MVNRRVVGKQRSEGLSRKMRAAERPFAQTKRGARAPGDLVCVLSQTVRLLRLRRARAGGAARLRIYGTHLD